METEDNGNDSPSRIPIIVTVVSALALVVIGVLSARSESTSLDIAFSLAQVVVISIVIWQACDPFADAAQWIGTTLRLPGSVRGATLDAVASSMPELFSGIFFVVVAINAADGSPEELQRAGGEGYGATVATCAGSAVYNMILIPAFCALVISYSRKSRPTIDVEAKVITRDGLWFVATQAVLIFFLFQPAMHWWMAVLLLVLYGIYIVQLYADARAYQRARHAVRNRLDQMGDELKSLSRDDLIETIKAESINVTLALVDEVRAEMRNEAAREDGDDEDPPETAGVLFGFIEIPLTHVTAWGIIAVSTVFAAAACYWLVEVTRETALQLNVPIFFVAVILAAAASSVPDTFLSIGASLRGDDSGAVSNAFGSNIFDICICLSIPLLVNSYLNGWEPVLLLQDGEPMPGLVGLRILLSVLTLITLLIMWHNRQLTRAKALVLCFLYGIFVAYAVAGSLKLPVFGIDL